MHSQRKMVGPTRFVVPMILAVLTGASCRSKAYPEPDAEALAAWEESMRDAGGLMGAPPPLPARGDENEPGESAPPVTSIDPGGSVGGQSGSSMTPGTCSGDAGACGDAGGGPVCVATGPRDCTSGLDNDCDGQPDDVIDDVCVCVAGATEACDAHPGFDGQGQCRAGSRTCLLDEATLTTTWSACEGAVGPGEQDSCTPGDDADCDGTPNEGCSCVEGEPQPCGSTTNTGPCQIGTSTCEGGRFGQCVGAVAPVQRDSCASRTDDSNCNGNPFEGCSCANGETQPCGSTEIGPCQLGTRTCVNGQFGPCVGVVAPAPRDSCSVQGDDSNCNGIPNEGCVQLLPDGAPCTGNGECEAGVCAQWFADSDGDGFGKSSDVRRTCGSEPPNGFADRGGDCCDLDGASRAVAARVNPGQQQFFYDAQTVCLDVGGYDYNCDGDQESNYPPDVTSCADVTNCAQRYWVGGGHPGCGVYAIAEGCVSVGGSCLLDGSPGASVYEEARCR
jgi:hypothetical protein